MSSCCGGNCGCGSDCKCGKDCQGCKMYPDMETSENRTSQTLITGVAPQKTHFEGSESGGVGAENDACKCNPCTCKPCNCK